MKVIATIQSKVSDNQPPVEVPWYNGDNAASALSAIANIMAQPDLTYTRTLSVRVEL